MKKRKEIKLNRIEQAILNLAKYIERCPFNEYKIREQTMDILGIEEIK